MSKNKKKSLNIAKIIAPIISSRDVLGMLKSAILKADAKSVDLNFKDVKFISRSAAHELLTIKDSVTKRVKIDFINTSDDVKEMLRTVAANRAVPAYKKINIKFRQMDIETLLREEVAA